MGSQGWHLRPNGAIRGWLGQHPQVTLHITLAGKRLAMSDFVSALADSPREQAIMEVEGPRGEVEDFFAMIEALNEDPDDVYDKFGTLVFDPNLAKFGKTPLLRSAAPYSTPPCKPLQARSVSLIQMALIAVVDSSGA